MYPVSVSSVGDCMYLCHSRFCWRLYVSVSVGTRLPYPELHKRTGVISQVRELG